MSTTTSTTPRSAARSQSPRGRHPSRVRGARVVRASNGAVVARERAQDAAGASEKALRDPFGNIANAGVNVVVVPGAGTREMLATTTTLRARFAAAEREFTASGIAPGDVADGRALAEALGVANATATGGELGGLEYDQEVETLFLTHNFNNFSTCVICVP